MFKYNQYLLYSSFRRNKLNKLKFSTVRAPALKTWPNWPISKKFLRPPNRQFYGQTLDQLETFVTQTTYSRSELLPRKYYTKRTFIGENAYSSHKISLDICLQLFHNNRWGYVCDSGTWSLAEAAIVCAQLGLSRGVRKTTQVRLSYFLNLLFKRL
jgi:hypothetical protein